MMKDKFASKTLNKEQLDKVSGGYYTGIEDMEPGTAICSTCGKVTMIYDAEGNPYCPKCGKKFAMATAI